jgi:hypothetical protein
MSETPPTAAAGPTSEFLDAVAERLAARRREKSGTGAGLSAPQQPIEAAAAGARSATSGLPCLPGSSRTIVAGGCGEAELLDHAGASVQMSDSEGQRR